MNIAILIAGGSGQRMGQDIPKQFLNIDDKPVIVYTMEAFQKHPNIDGIIVVCIKGWYEILKAYAKQFNITKLVDIVEGGNCGQASIKNGLMRAKEIYKDDDIVLIHDAIRPMVSEEIISDNIAKCMTYGNAVTAIPCAEAMLQTEDEISSNFQINRDSLRRTQTPQTFRLGDILSAHEEANNKGITNSIASCTLYIELGRKVYFSTGSEKNLKLTTPDDIEIFKALLKTKKADWMK
jgi:2-C-methyl-D-erythritol 4-phosphate cytidylyltransferase